jgi:pimeloyl-ACP methyl ester carboxylesterase
MSKSVLNTQQSQQRQEDWYRHFLSQIPGSTQSHWIDGSFGKSHVLEAGNASGPTLVCLHAMMTSSAHLLSELKPLLNEYHIYAPDIPGESARGIPQRLPYDDQSHQTWLLEILDALSIDTASVLGISLGGFIARKLATQSPERVEKLILVVPAGIVQGSVFKGLMNMMWPMLKYRLRPTESNLKTLLDPLLTKWDDDWGPYMGDAFRDFSMRTAIPPVASDDQLQSLSMPCLVIGADQDISFPGRPLIERVETCIPTVETELISDCKHCPPTTDEFRQWLANRVSNFLIA